MAHRTSDLSLENVLRDVHDAESQSLRTSAEATIVAPGSIEVNINHQDDSVSLGNGDKLLTSTEAGGKVSLDVNVTNDLEMRPLDSDTDSVAADIRVAGADVSNTNPVPNIDLAKPFNKPWNKVRIATKNENGDPLTIITSLAGTDVQLATVVYDIDGDFQSLEVTNL